MTPRSNNKFYKVNFYVQVKTYKAFHIGILKESISKSYFNVMSPIFLMQIRVTMNYDCKKTIQVKSSNQLCTELRALKKKKRKEIMSIQYQ